jgi:hypothetical protein
MVQSMLVPPAEDDLDVEDLVSFFLLSHPHELELLNFIYSGNVPKRERRSIFTSSAS